MTRPETIAIDGSAASGKSTIAALLSQKLDYHYLDTGVMYRAVTWATLAAGVDPQEEAAVSSLAATLELEIQHSTTDGTPSTVLVNGQDVTQKIRQPDVDANVSLVSSYPKVRQILTAEQRRIARQGAIIMVGRDIGTVVLPDAELKIFTQASAEERARRRYEQLAQTTTAITYEDVLAAIIERDNKDKQKPISPMVAADDAIIINTDGITAEEVIQQILQYVD